MENYKDSDLGRQGAVIKEASVYEVNELIGAGAECQVIDVREYSEYNTQRIADAQLMPLSSFERHASEIDHSKPVYLMCRSGNRARQAAERLKGRGFTDIHVVQGGMAAWTKADLPVIKGESRVWSLERQVRFTAGVLILTSLALGVLFTPYFYILTALLGVGLVFSAATDTCGMAMVLARMPWNRGAAACETKPARS